MSGALSRSRSAPDTTRAEGRGRRPGEHSQGIVQEVCYGEVDFDAIPSRSITLDHIPSHFVTFRHVPSRSCAAKGRPAVPGMPPGSATKSKDLPSHS
eukprot:6335641-Pyramimonas_sp.AAC.1